MLDDIERIREELLVVQSALEKDRLWLGLAITCAGQQTEKLTPPFYNNWVRKFLGSSKQVQEVLL
jgi:hypothetical protein